MELPLKGNIKKISLVKLLVYLNRSRKTGTLSLVTPAFTKKLFINAGDVVFASSTYVDDRLGEMLLKAGKISVEQYDKAVKVLKTSDKRLGAILVELGYLAPKELFWGVKYQVKEIIQGMFQLEDADYEFTEMELPTQEVITLKMSMGDLIYDSVKRIENWTRIRNEMPDTSSLLRLSSDPLSLFQQIELSTHDKKILSLVDGKNTIKEVIENSWMGSFEALKILYVLWSIGIVELTGPADSVISNIEADPEQYVEMSLDDILQPCSEEEEALLKRIDSIYSVLNTLSPADLLGIDKNSDADAVKKSYYRLAKEFHPDRCFTIHDDTVKAKLSAIFDTIATAYSILKDDKPRADYFRATPVRRDKAVAPGGPDKAEEQFKRGIDEFKRGNYWGAIENFKWSVKLAHENANYLNYLSLALSKVPGRLKEAEETLQAAVKLEPFNTDYQANLGLIYLKAGMKKRAIGCFENALKIDPKNDKAARGLQQARQ
jgi:curved DNA-binding protein CbpA